MKKKHKRITAILVAAALICGLAACGDEKSTVQLMDEPNNQPEYLSFFSLENMSGSNIAKYWSDHFTELYDKRVYINFDGAAYYAEDGLSYRELLEKRMESSSPDDMYIINAEDVLEFGQKGYWMDLSNMDFVQNLSDTALYQSTYDGKVFSLPLSLTGFGFLWNVDMLEDHGMEVPENLDEFLNVCEKLKSEGILPYGANKGYALTVPAMCVGLEELYADSNREEKMEELNSGKVSISRYMRSGFEFINQMIEKGYLDPEQALATTPREGDIELFLAGECAFICAGFGTELGMEGESFRMEMTGLPVLPAGSIVVYGADMRLCVNPESKHLNTVLEFMEMVGSREALETSATLNHSMSVVKDRDLTEVSEKQKMEELLNQPGQIPNQDFSLYFNTWESIRDVCREICAGTHVNRACQMLDQKQQEELESYK